MKFEYKIEFLFKNWGRKVSLKKSNTIINRKNASYCLLWYWHAALIVIAVPSLCLIKRDYHKMIKIKYQHFIHFFVFNIFWPNKKNLNNIRQFFRILRKSVLQFYEWPECKLFKWSPTYGGQRCFCFILKVWINLEIYRL